MIKNLAIALLLLISAAFARAQDYPKRPINLVIPLAPGDATDTSARAVADELSRELNVPIDYAPPDKLLADMREEHRRVSKIARQAGLVK